MGRAGAGPCTWQDYNGSKIYYQEQEHYSGKRGWQRETEKEDHATSIEAQLSRWSLDAGIDISYLQQQLGHSSLSTTAIYLQARPNHRRKEYEKAGFDKLLNPY